MLRKLLFLPFMALAVQAQVHVPQVGSIRCADGSLRPVYGVPASFVIGKPLPLLPATSSSFSDAGGIAATRDRIQLLNAAGKQTGELKIADPGTLVNIDTDASSAIAWLPLTSSLVYWEDNSFHQTVLPVPLSGRVTSLRRDGQQALLLVVEEGSVSENAISLSSGDLLSVKFLSGVEGPVFRTGEFTLFPNAVGLEIEGPEGRRSITIPASELAMERMSSEWVHISSSRSAQHWALQVTGSVLHLLELPALPNSEIAK